MVFNLIWCMYMLSSSTTNAWPVFSLPDGGVAVKSAFNGSIHLSPTGSGDVVVASRLSLDEEAGIKIGNAELNGALLTELLSLSSRVAALESERHAAVQGGTSSSSVGTLVNYSVASGVTVSEGSAVTYIIDSASGNMQLSLSYPQATHSPLADVDSSELVCLSETSMIFAYRDRGNQGFGTLVAGEVDATGNITFSTPDIFNSAETEFPKLARLSQTDFVVMYDSKTMFARWAGGLFSFSSPSSFASLHPSSVIMYEYNPTNAKVIPLSSSRFVVCVEQSVLRSGNSNSSMTSTSIGIYVGTVGGAGITYATALTYVDTTADVHLYDAVEISNSDFLVVFRTDRSKGICKLGSISGSGASATVSYGAPYQFDSGLEENHVIAAKLTASTVILAYLDKSDGSSGVCRIATITGVAITYSSEFRFASHIFSLHNVVALDANSVFVQFQRSPSIDRVTGVTGVVDTVAQTIRWGSPYGFQETTSLGRLSGSRIAGIYGGQVNIWYKTTAGTLTSPRNLGIVSQVSPDGNSAVVAVAGSAEVPSGTLLRGHYYYASSTSTLTTEWTPYPVGLATSSHTLLLQANKHDPHLSNSANEEEGLLSQGGVMPGEIRTYGGTRVPDGWLDCDGSSVSRATYQDLFAAIGTSWGFVDPTSFNLPDLRGRVLVGAGERTNSTAPRFVGSKGGSETTSLTLSQLPAHTHAAKAYIYRRHHSGSHTTLTNYVDSTAEPYTGGTWGSKVDVENSGGGQSHENMPPFAVVSYIIKI